MVQLTTEQRVFVVETYLRTNSYIRVKQAFAERFGDREPPSKSTIDRNVRKYRNHGTSLNRNKGNSGRRRTATSRENIEAVRHLLEENPNVSSRRNGI